MEHKRYVSTDFYEYLGEDADLEKEAEKHPGSIKGFTHWSSSGWDEKNQCPMSVLTFDPDCPRCQELSTK